MALTNCSECGGTISTKALSCPHCGAPVELCESIIGSSENIVNYDGEMMDATAVVEVMHSKVGSVKSAIWDMCDKAGISEDDKTISGFIFQIYELFKNKYGYEPEHLNLIIPPSEEEVLQREYEKKLELEQAQKKQSKHVPHCPTCGSTDIETLGAGTRAAAGVMFGLFSKTARSQFRCRNCGYKW